MLFHNKGPIKQYLNRVLNIVIHGRTAEISGSFEPNEVSADKVQSCWTGAEGRAALTPANRSVGGVHACFFVCVVVFCFVFFKRERVDRNEEPGDKISIGLFQT